jgi:hypothetical protein
LESVYAPFQPSGFKQRKTAKTAKTAKWVFLAKAMSKLYQNAKTPIAQSTGSTNKLQNWLWFGRKMIIDREMPKIEIFTFWEN